MVKAMFFMIRTSATVNNLQILTQQ